MDTYKPYPEYKDSNLPWLGKIPAEWNLKRAKWYLKSKKEINTDGSCRDVLSLTLRGVVDNDPDKPEGLVPSDYRSYQIFEKNNLVFKLIDLENYKTSRVGLVHRRGIMSPAYIRVIVDSPDLSPKFYYYFYYSLYLQGVYNKIGAGVRATLSAKRLLDLPIPIPEKQEQDKISFFLDRKLKQIAKFIRNKRRLIQLLQEQKQAIINQAVTRGINPNVRLKPSGVDYLGDIPEHWEVKPLKRIAWFKGGSGFPHKFQGKKDCDVPFLKVSDMTLEGNDIWIYNFTNTISMNIAKELGATIFPKNTIVFPKVGGAMLTNKRRILSMPSCIDNNMMGCVILGNIDLDFLFFKFTQIDLGLMTKPGPVPAISEREVREIRISVPPIDEQKQIVHFIQEKIKLFDRIILASKYELNLAFEYQTRLISDVVTGKIDIRNIPVEPIEESQSDEGLDMVEEEQIQEELENFEEKTYENL